MTRAAAASKALLALVLLGFLVGGVPAVLLHIGAIPTTLPAARSIWATLLGPDSTGQVLFGLLAAAVWLCWAAFTLSVAREIAAAITTRGTRPARPVRGLDWAGRPAAVLVAVVLAAFVLTPAVTAVAAQPAQAAPATHQVASTATAGPSSDAAHHSGETGSAALPAAPTPAPHRSNQSRQPDAAPGTRQYTVQRRDTLWAIAERELGDPLTYRQIAALNPQIGPGFTIRPGMTLHLPPRPPAGGQQDRETHVNVRRGDTLSGIAAEHGVKDWHQIWPANHGAPEPGGEHFTNPDHIEPGWSITIPGAATPAARTPARPLPAHRARPRRAAPSRHRRAPRSGRPQSRPHPQPRRRPQPHPPRESPHRPPPHRARPRPPSQAGVPTW